MSPVQINLRKTVRIAFGALVLVLLCLALISQWHAIRDHVGDLSISKVALTFVLLLCALASSMMAWRALVEDMGTHLPVHVAARVFLVGQLAKYLPGSVWTVVASMELGRDHGLPRQHTGAASLIIYPLNVAVAVCFGAATFTFAATRGALDYAWTLLVLPICIIGLHPRVLTPVLNRVARLARREPLERQPSLRGMAVSGVWTVVTFMFSGLHIYVLALDLGAAGKHVLLVSLGAWATAWVVGFVLVIFPGGIGPREVAMVNLMQPVLNTGAGAVLVIASRLLFAIAEVVAAGAAAVAVSIGRTRLRGRTAGGENPAGT